MVSQAHWIKDQTVWTACSLSVEILVLPLADMKSPKTTIERIPETPKNVNSAK